LKKTQGFFQLFFHSEVVSNSLVSSNTSNKLDNSIASGILIFSSDFLSSLKIFSFTNLSCKSCQLAKYFPEIVLIACLFQ
jgi:hypothetical protein